MSFLTNAIRGITRNVRSSILPASTLRASASTASALQQTDPQQIAKEDEEKRKEVFQNVNNLIKSDDVGRLFAVVHLCGKQFKVTDGDIIIVEGHWPPTNGDRIRLDKVLLAGCKDFTLVGRPMLEPGLVDVQATIIEKTLSHTKTHFKKKRRKQYMRINFFRFYNTMIRINSIELRGLVNQPARTEETKSLKLF